MANKKFFTIIAGRREPAEVLQGTLNKTTGLPDANAQKIGTVVGKILILNFSRAWGRRFYSNDKGTKTFTNSATDPKYRGEIEFLPFGAPGGEVIETRWLPNSKSLDKNYQDTIQKLKMRDEDAYVELEQGLNNFDEGRDEPKVTFLTHHGLMAGNESADPNNSDYDMMKYDPSSRNQSRIQKMLVKDTANKYVLDARQNQGRTAILATIFGKDPKIQDDVLIEELLDKAEAYPEAFVETINKFITGAIITLGDAEAVSIIELEPDSDIIKVDSGNGRKEILLSRVEGKGHDRFMWVAQNAMLDEKIFDAVKTVETLLTQYRRMKDN